jgi:predicted transcriptional regulator
MKYRSKTDIMAMLLESAKIGVTKTKLMYKAFLSFNQLKEYLLVLEENGLLTYDQSSMTYKTTAKGNEFLAMNEKLNELSGLAIVDGIQEGGRKRRSSSLPKR